MNIKKIKPRRLKLTLMAIPFVVYVVMFSYVPIFGWALAFFDYKPGKAFSAMEFAGFKYFELIGYYWSDIRAALVNTLVLSALSLLTMVVPVVLAIMINEVPFKGLRKGIQTLATTPHFISWVVAYAIMFAFFSSDGMVNRLLYSLGYTGQPTDLLGNPDVSWTLMTLLEIWKEAGWSAIIYLAAIVGIDEQLYDAAKVDGASKLQRIRHITLPGLLPTYFVLLLLKVGNLLSVGFDKYLAFNNPMVASKLEVLDVYTYRIGIGTQDYSFSIAVGILKSVVSIILLLSANAFSKRTRGEGII